MNLKTLFYITIIFTISLYANESKILYQKAQIYEKQGNYKKAMIFYKKAASIFIKPTSLKIKTKKLEAFLKNKHKKLNAIESLGKNEIQGYKFKSTDQTVKQMVFSKFDFKPYYMNYILPLTYDSVYHKGRSSTEVKFQISIKSSLVKNILGLNDELFFGYTQTAWWQITEASAPFRETNYMPELFLIIPNIYHNNILKAYKIGLLHQSNGRAGLSSRSWNRIYLATIFQQGGLFVIPRVWYRIPEKKKKNIYSARGDDNPNIYDYMGYGDLKIFYPYKKNLFSILIRNNLKLTRNNKGAFQFNWTFPLPWVSNMFGYVQIFSGYGESLIDYNKLNNKIGIGFAISR